ncbi:MFS general substrate transporter [Aspergillus saccharolyticus JOP 1030-1]|uniref:MFS general substrate transporter n=1 Tax=Aspergillus saccharolyticus JOP 1030-1 TaxID=1450539 RepID=A0A318Z0L7_9EURO|nr:MFS general substrate transporter [Aspergillus saccharolyticus JOP 1030-1]PYH40815.1 MFS general substrate transporter [Aspergillus saccharolyticus JOP 1030-1]
MHPNSSPPASETPAKQPTTQVKDESHDGALQLLAATARPSSTPRQLTSSVIGLRESAHLHGNQYNWISSIFFFGQLAFSFLTVRLLQAFPLARYVAVNVIVWGAILAYMAACHTFAALMVCRTFLGVAEAAIVPAWVVFTSQGYRKEEQAFRVGIWFAMCGFAQMFGGYIAYGIAVHIDSSAPLRGWQIIFLVLGGFTVVVGVLFLFILPDSPVTARRRTWLYAFWVFAAKVPNSIATSFGNILVTGMGYSSRQSLLLVTPLGAMRTEQRLFWCIIGHIPSIVGAILMATTEKTPALIGYYLSGGVPIGWTTILGLTSTNVAGSTKKITVVCIQTVAYTVGNIISPQTFQAKDAPRYLPAKISIVVLYVLITIDLCLIRWVAVREKRRRDAEKEAEGDAHVVQQKHEFMDLTDRVNREFRYAI